jgi:hypothetical protein
MDVCGGFGADFLDLVWLLECNPIRKGIQRGSTKCLRHARTLEMRDNTNSVAGVAAYNCFLVKAPRARVAHAVVELDRETTCHIVVYKAAAQGLHMPQIPSSKRIVLLEILRLPWCFQSAQNSRAA